MFVIFSFSLFLLFFFLGFDLVFFVVIYFFHFDTNLTDNSFDFNKMIKMGNMFIIIIIIIIDVTNNLLQVFLTDLFRISE